MKRFLCLLMMLSFISSAYVQAQSNGCGPQALGFISDLLPNGPMGLKEDLFIEACNTHDSCYFVNNSDTQASCDTDFLITMLAACETNYAGSDDFDYCNNSAHSFYGLVDQYGEQAVASRFQTDELTYSIADFAKLELTELKLLPSFLGDDLSMCVDVQNVSKINTSFKLFLYAAEDRVVGELPEGDFLLAWHPPLEFDSFFLRASDSTNICLGTDGFLGLARNTSQFKGKYRLELWVNSARTDLRLSLADALEADLP